MAKRGNWRTVLRTLDRGDRLVEVKQWRPGGKTWLTVLHQAGWNGAPLDVAARLIERGALRSQTDARGRTSSAGRSARAAEAAAPTVEPRRHRCARRQPHRDHR